MNKKIMIPYPIKTILKILEDNNHKAYLVGGSIRDLIMNLKPKDYDIATSATCDEFKTLFKDYKIITVDKVYNIVSIILDNKIIHISTFRDDKKTLQGDLLLRDFTINSLAYSIKEGIIDYYNNLEDIKNKIIKINENDEKRLLDDPLRILRAIRLSSLLKFNIDETTKKLLFKHKDALKGVSPERINSELVKILLSPKASVYIKEYFDIFIVFMKELEPLKGFNQNNSYHIYDCLDHTLKVIDGVKPNIIMRLVALFHDSGKPLSYTEDENHIGHFYNHHIISIDIAKTVLKRLKFSSKIIDRVCHLIHYHDYPLTLTKKSIRKLLNYFGTDDIFNLLDFKKADISAQNPKYLDRLNNILEAEIMIRKIIDSNECYSLKQLKINGNDLKNIGINDGRLIGNILNNLLNLVIQGKISNDKEVLLNKVIQDIKRKR